MTTTPKLPVEIRDGSTVYADPIRTDGSDHAYPAGTLLVSIYEDDGDRYVTVCPSEIAARFYRAFGITR